MGSLLGNAILWLPLSAAVGVQVFKFLWEWARRRDFDLRVLARSGGMPSSHSAMVTSLATAVALQYGVDSGLFATTVIFAIVVMYDASGVRQATGKQAKVLNQIVRELFSGQPVSEEELKELIGHTPVEVIVGALVGMGYTIGWLEFMVG